MFRIQLGVYCALTTKFRILVVLKANLQERNNFIKNAPVDFSSRVVTSHEKNERVLRNEYCTKTFQSVFFISQLLRCFKLGKWSRHFVPCNSPHDSFYKRGFILSYGVLPKSSLKLSGDWGTSRQCAESDRTNSCLEMFLKVVWLRTN